MAIVAQLLEADVEPETDTRALESLEPEPTSPAVIDPWVHRDGRLRRVRGHALSRYRRPSGLLELDPLRQQ